MTRGKPILDPDDEPALAKLRGEILDRRDAGRVLVEFRRLHAPTVSAQAVATALVESLGLRAPNEWTEVDAPRGMALATRVLHSDLAHTAPLMPFDHAEGLARRFLALCGEGAVFVTNGTLALVPTGGAWSPLTAATFDTGVIGISAQRIGLLWVEDED